MCLFLKFVLCVGFLTVTKCQGVLASRHPYYINDDWRLRNKYLVYYPYNEQVIRDTHSTDTRQLRNFYSQYYNQDRQSGKRNANYETNRLLMSRFSDGCIAPDGSSGNCIPIRQCGPMIDVLKKIKRPVSPSISSQLNAYTCGFSGSGRVCCPQGPIIIQEMVEVSSSPPDVSTHRNLYLLPEDCGYFDPGKDRIRHGQNADLNEFPWMALLSYRTRRGPDFKCGGTILNNRYILTAAHCLKNLDSPLLGIRVGEYNIKTKQDCVELPDRSTKCTVGVQDLAIEEIIPHPQFDPNIISNDIGLVRVSRMNLDVENARPVCLPLEEQRDAEFKNVIVTGWGVTDVQTGATSAILQKVNLPVVDIDYCRNVYKNQSRAKITYRQVCAGGKNQKDSCPGDSGGPLHIVALVKDNAAYVQQGIVSFGPRECGLEGYPGVYTRVAYYMDWILDTIRP